MAVPGGHLLGGSGLPCKRAPRRDSALPTHPPACYRAPLHPCCRADCRDCNFSNSNLSTAYFMKSVLARANFENADLSDTLMDRSVIVEANLRGAVLQVS